MSKTLLSNCCLLPCEKTGTWETDSNLWWLSWTTLKTRCCWRQNRWSQHQAANNTGGPCRPGSWRWWLHLLKRILEIPLLFPEPFLCQGQGTIHPAPSPGHWVFLGTPTFIYSVYMIMGGSAFVLFLDHGDWLCHSPVMQASSRKLNSSKSGIFLEKEKAFLCWGQSWAYRSLELLW